MDDYHDALYFQPTCNKFDKHPSYKNVVLMSSLMMLPTYEIFLQFQGQRYKTTTMNVMYHRQANTLNNMDRSLMSFGQN